MTTAITLRATKGSALTHDEMDTNLTNLQTTADDALAATETLTADKAEAAALGVANTDQNMGSYTGATISDNQTAKQNIQELETALESVSSSAATKAEAAALGVTASATDMGTFTGSTISDNGTAKEGMQELETAHETLITDLASTASGKGAWLVKWIQAGASAVARWVGDKLRETVSVKDFGALGDGVTVSDAAITATDTELTSATAAFTSADVGKYIEVTGAGAAGAVLQSTIATYNSATSVELTDVASTTVSGAGCTFGTNDGPAINALLTQVLTDKTRRRVFFPAPGAGKFYLAGETLTISSIDCCIYGDGSGLPTIIKAYHSSGPALRVLADRQGVSGMTIGATPARKNGSVGSGTTTNCGILHFASVSLARYVRYRDVRVPGHPADGIIMAGIVNYSSLKGVDCSSNLRHGLALDNGTIVGSAVSDLPGSINIDGFVAYDNAGHGIRGGHESETDNRCVRVHMRNIELGRNAESAGSRLSADQMWIFGSQIRVESSGFSGYNQAGTTETTGGIRIAGTDNKLISNRFLNVSDHAITVDSLAEFPTDNIEIDGVMVSSGTPLDPAVVEVNSPSNVRVFTGTTSAMDSLVSSTKTKSLTTTKVIYKVTDETVTSSTTLQNDDVLKFNIPFEKQRVVFRAVLIFAGPAAGDIKFAFTVPSGATLRWGPTSNVIVDTADAIVVQDAVVASGTAIALGTAATRRILEVVGEVVTAGTAGDVTLQWAQNTSDASATTVYGQSHIVLEL